MVIKATLSATPQKWKLVHNLDKDILQNKHSDKLHIYVDANNDQKIAEEVCDKDNKGSDYNSMAREKVQKAYS